MSKTNPSMRSQGEAIAKATNRDDIAIVGMSIHVPGADTLEAYWTNLRDGVSSIRKLDDEALAAAGEAPDKIARSNYVPYAATLDKFDMFDADFFGFSPKEAAILDPQHRKFLELSWTALENAGHPPESVDGNIGVYAGCGMGSYFYFNICSNPDMVDDVGMFLLRHTGNDKDFLSTRVSHLLDLNGPSINVQTACSTSLVATHYACQALRNGECNMALAGGVTIELPHGRGYLFKENEILSPDGQCHAFDHRAEGTVFGSGAGVVALRRLSDAIADGDHIWAVIKGSAINNDGADKAGYLAPSVSGQASAIAKAHENAGISAETLEYIECHGTGTYLGDPIEVSALTQGFRATTDATDFCRIGSVKTNIGHLDTAAGVASLVKTSLAIHNAAMPPSLGYEAANPVIEFDGSPFSVNDTLTPWHSDLRRAGVNSLGVGGTNAHMVLEQAPARAQSEASDWPFQILTISARSKAALEANTTALAQHLASTDQDLADIAFTLKEGRRGFEHRRIVVADSHAEATKLLTDADPHRVFTHQKLGDAPQVVFMFPGGGAQYPDMARDLYETEPVFQEWMDRGLDHLQPKLNYDIRALWLPNAADKEAAAKTLTTPSIQLPLIMMVEYALAKLWMSWGVQPTALVGHSMGENTAACLAGVLSFEDCIDLVHLRGQLFDRVAPGGMLSVPLPVAEIEPFLGDDLDVACRNAPDLTVISGPQAALDALQAKLADQDVTAQRIQIDIAAHSKMLDLILPEFRDFLARLNLNAPQLPIIANRTGIEMTDAQATDPDYWVDHLRNTVNFADCLATLSATPNRVFLEVGPGKALSSLAQISDDITPNQVISTLRHPDQDIADDKYFLTVIGRLWATGVEADWEQIWGDARRNRVPLPSYQFQQSRYFIEPGQAATHSKAAPLIRQDDIADWGYRPAWRPQYAAVDTDLTLETAKPQTWLIFADEAGVCDTLAIQIKAAGQVAVTVRTGDFFAKTGDGTYSLAPEQGRNGYDLLLADLAAQNITPTRIIHGWLLTESESFRPGSSFFDRNKDQGFLSLTFLAQSIGESGLESENLHCTILTNGAAKVFDEALPWPEKAMIQGPAGVIPREFPGLTCATIDIDLPIILAKKPKRTLKPQDHSGLATQLIDDLLAPPANAQIALRDGRRFEQSWRKTALPEGTDTFLKNGTYLITGGLGGIGLAMAETLVRDYQAKVILVSRTQLPARKDWDRHLLKTAPNAKTASAINAIRALEALGGTVLPIAADIADLDQMHDVIATAADQLGPINGVIHAAGAIDDAPILTKSQTSIDAVLSAKVQGLRVLDTLFPDGTLDQLILCSSTSTVTRPAGQVDYVAANEYLNAYAKSRSDSATKVVAVDWGVWADVGMAANATGVVDADETPQEIDQPLLQNARFDADGTHIFSATHQANQNWLLDEHRMADGTAVLPGTGYLELIAQSLAAQGDDMVFEVTDLMFASPLVVPDSAQTGVEVHLKNDAQSIDFKTVTQITTGGRDALQTHASATIRLLSNNGRSRLDLNTLTARTKPRAINGTWTSPQEVHLNFGPRWRVMQEMRLGEDEGLAKLSLPAIAKNDLATGFLLHPALMDIATGWAIDLAQNYTPDTLWVPVSYDRVTVLRALPADIISWVRVADDTTPNAARFDITICDAFGNICVEIEGFSMHQLDGALDLGASPAAHLINEITTSSTAQKSPAEERLAYNVSQGIRASEGAQAMQRALTLKASQVVVSSLDLDGLIAQANETVVASDAQTFERPDIDSDFIAPETETQATLAEFWQSLLGLSQVGIEDSFFDLGGHSLIAVRLFAMIKREFDVNLPISILFEAPTIAKCAALIDARNGASKAVSVAEDAPETQFTHLVPMSDTKAEKPPFFLVAGMFGNVLNLRHLAQLVGADRPVYGLQARGLLGDEAPHDNVAEAARDYIAEMRNVQPHGPYAIGGFSGGGITAYEIAQQLSEIGEEVSALVMLDTPLPVRPTLSNADKALIKIHEVRRKGLGYLKEWAQDRAEWRRVEAAYEAGETPSGGYHDRAIEAAFLNAVGTYDLQPWHGPLTLMRPPLDRHWSVSGGRWVSAAKEYVFDDNEWSDWAPGLNVIEVPGDHDSMVLEPNVRALARHLIQILAYADQGAAPVWVPATAAE